jgi:uroporphyrinogen decarboxylase
MTGRDIIRRAVHFEGPERVGMTLPEPYPRDLVTWGTLESPDFDSQRRVEGGNEYWLDEWGCTWGRIAEISKGEIVEGAITEWDQLDAYRPPDFSDDRRYAKARERLAASADKYLIAGLPGGWVFATARKIRKMEQYLMDLVLERDRIEQLHDLIVAENEKVIRKAAELGCHAVMVWEDWGTQTGPLVSPEMFREIFKPRIKAQCDLAHSLGLDCWMHSCGNMTDLMDDLIDAGVQVFQFDQPTLHGIDNLNNRYGGKVAFWCPVDIQKTLQTKDAALIRAEAKALCETLGGHNGGFVAGYYGDNVALALDPSVQDIACQAFVEFGGGANA